MLALTFLPTLGIGSLTSAPLASFAGALGAVGIVYGLARVKQSGLSTDVLLLAGVTLNAFFSALILFVQFLADDMQALRTLRWLMGDLDVSSYAPMLGGLPLLAAAFGAFVWIMRALNLLALGPEAAMTRGVDVHRIQRQAFFAASVATGAAVSIGGPIGFIGIVIPHLVRLLVGADHRLVLPSSAFFGAAFLVACDALARTALAPLEIPVGVITAIVGGPFFLWMLVTR
jgi:iron complex transport system permease protein